MTLVLVEDYSDVCWYLQFFDPNKAKIYGTGGCEHLQESVRRLVENNFTCLAIKDADFDRVLKNRQENPNVVITDKHDIEMTAWSHEEVKSRVFNLNGKDYDDGLVSSLFEILKDLSFIKMYNAENGSHMKVRNIRALEHNKIKSLEELLDEIGKRSPDVTMPTAIEIQDYEKSHDTLDYYDITNGHDYLWSFTYKFNNGHIRNFNEDIMVEQMKGCFTLDLFKMTEMYAQIVEWENRNHRKILRTKAC